MSIVEVKIGNRMHQLACEDGQEAHLKSLADTIDSKINMLSEQMRSNNESLLLVMAALMTQDEANEATKRASAQSVQQAANNDNDEEVAGILNSISAYLDNLSEKVSRI